MPSHMAQLTHAPHRDATITTRLKEKLNETCRDAGPNQYSLMQFRKPDEEYKRQG